MIIFTETGFLVMFLAHILADFYCQSNKMAENCRKDFKGVEIHSAVYAAVILVVLLLGYPLNWTLVELWAGMIITHFLIDGLKHCVRAHWLPDYLKRKPKLKEETCEFAIFVIDQCLHLILMIVFWYWFGVKMTLWEYVTWKAEHLPVLPISLILSVALVLKPTGIMIQRFMLTRKPTTDSKTENGKSDQSNSAKQKDDTATSNTSSVTTGSQESGLEAGKNDDSQESDRGAGKWIGYLERLIILMIVMYHQYNAIAFVLTAKSVARFKAIEDNRITAEYYLTGTLMSAAATLVIAVLLGICGNGA